MKRVLVLILLITVLVFSHTIASAVMPPLGSNQWGTDTDNEDDALTGNPDNDMDVSVGYNVPIEFNIFIPLDAPRTDYYTITISAGDVDTGPPWFETEDLSLNGNFVGVLTGINGTFVENTFTVPTSWINFGDNNLVQIIMTCCAGYGVNIDYGYLTAPVPLPAMSTIGLIVFMLFAGAGSILYLRRKRAGS